MLKKLSLLIALIACSACIASCNTAPVENPPDSTPPEETTPARETYPQTLEEMQQAYPEYNIFSLDAYEHVRGTPNGTPDPKPYGIPETATAEGIEFKADQASVSVDFDVIKFTLSKTIASEKDFFYCRALRLEKLENGEWKRLYYLPYIIVSQYEWPAVGVSGPTSIPLEISRKTVISPIEPGTYRAIAFVGYECTPFYAEFEIK